MQITLVVNSLVQGGAQRFTVDFAKELVRNGHKVALITFYPPNTDFFEIPEGVNVTRLIYPFQDNGRISLGLQRNKITRWLVRKKLRVQDFLHLRDLIVHDKPDLVIAVERYVGMLVATVLPRNVKLIVSERVHPENHNTQVFWKPIDGIIRRLLFRQKNTYLHAQGHEIAMYMRKEFCRPVMVVPNFVTNNKRFTIDSSSKRERTVLSVGRFVHQKGFDLLLEAWATIPEPERRGWKLRIIGAGDQSPYRNIAQNRDILSSVSMEDAIVDISSALRAADIFVLASRYEGFPNSLAEAMSYGLPTIATDCPSAIRELTKNGTLSRLVPMDSLGISNALRDLMSDAQLRQQLGLSARKVTEIFSIDRILMRWEEFFDFVLENDANLRMSCPVCMTYQSKSSIVDLKSSDQIIMDLETEWDIVIEKSDINKKIVLRYRCDKCGVSFFNAKAGDAKFYESCHKSKLYERKNKWDYIRSVEYLQSSHSYYDSILDLGSGRSKFIDLIDGSSEILDIVEIDQGIARLQTGKVRSVFTDLNNVGGKYDLIMMSHYLEHVEKPRELLLKILTLCRPNSLVAVTVPSASSNEYDASPLDWPPHHTLRFSPLSLDYLFSSLGFKKVSMFREKEDSETGFDFLTLYRLSS